MPKQVGGAVEAAAVTNLAALRWVQRKASTFPGSARAADRRDYGDRSAGRWPTTL